MGGIDIRKYIDLIGLFTQFGWIETKKRRHSAEPAFSDEVMKPPISPTQADRLTRRLEKMGPCYIKLGQFLSSRSDLFPKVMLTSLGRLQDDVAPFEFEAVRTVIETELGVRLSKAFTEFDPYPLASASLSQVHRATLYDGRKVAVKIQRPDIQKTIFKDLRTLQKFASFIDRTTRAGRRLRTRGIMDEFQKSLVRELDYRIEAAQINALRENLRGFERIVLPETMEEFCTGKILTMSLLSGRKVTEITPLARTEIDGITLADDLFGAYLHQVLIDGMFHADPHPGNILLMEDNHIGLLDLGMVSTLTPDVQNKLTKFLGALNEGHARQAGTHLLEISARAYGFNEKDYFNQMTILIGKYQGFGGKPVQIGRMVMDILQVSAQCGIILPTELTLLGKTLMQLDEVGQALDPDFDPAQVLRKHIRKMLRRRMRKETTLDSVFEIVLETQELIAKSPRRLNAFFGKLAENEMSVRVDMLDEKYLMTGFQKIANRLTTGLILAALIIGAAFMMNVRTDFTVAGYPGLAVIFFIIAGLGGVVLIFNILFQDESVRRK